MASRSNKLYENSPRVEKDKDGKPEIRKGSSEAVPQGEQEPAKDENGGAPVVQTKEMHDRHISEMKDMHERHEKEHKDMHKRHQKEVGKLHEGEAKEEKGEPDKGGKKEVVKE